MKPELVDVGTLEDFPEGAPVLRKLGAHRLVCVRSGGDVHALDDRCPHQGYPLSQGCVKDGVLTCEWHNWKFELATGACTFGGEPVRRYATRVEAGRVLVDPAVDRAREAARLTDSFAAAMREGSATRALREGLRLAELARSDDAPAPGGEPSLGGPRGAIAFGLLARDGAERAEYGFDHGLAVLADACTWAERGEITPEEAFLLCADAIAEPSLHLGPRPIPRQTPDDALDPARVAEALVAERRDEAEARVRALVRARGAEVTVREGLLPFVTQHIYEYGHGTIFLSKALELSRRFPSCAEALLAASTVELAWATAETTLPPFAATRGALTKLAETRVAPRAGASFERTRYLAEVLSGERAALDATLALIENGVDPTAILRAAGHAAAARLRRFDATWEERLDAEVSVLGVTHAVTFVEASLALLVDAPADQVARVALLAAGFIGKLRRADAPGRPPAGDARAYGSLLEAARARDAAVARAFAAELDGDARRAAHTSLAPFLALEAAVRPIFYAHTVKMSEATQRLAAADPEGGGVYLDALLAYAVPRRPERRVARNAAVARKFLADGRPPEGLY